MTPERVREIQDRDMAFYDALPRQLRVILSEAVVVHYGLAERCYNLLKGGYSPYLLETELKSFLDKSPG